MSIANTIKTTLGFLKTLITRYTRIDLSRASLEGIFNYVKIDERVRTSGQPTEAQFELVRAAGFQRVINLAPHGGENALPDEARTLADLGIDYIHIPVDFQRPQEEDFRLFCEAMAQAVSQPIWIHCAANMRVSAFMFRYRRDMLGQPPHQIEPDLAKIWKPMGVWKEFVS